MRSKIIEYVPEFNMETARFDRYDEFYNSYRRKYQMDAGTTNIRKLNDGAVEAAYNTYSAQHCPFTHLTTGEVLVDRCDDPEKRGRYTFCGYDFTVISTTNDRLGAIAMKHMRVLDPDLQHVKINAASLSTTASGDTKDGRTLLIDHIGQRVYSAGRSYHPEGVTSDGKDMAAVWAGVPQNRAKEAECLYITAPGGLVYPTTPIRVAHLERGDTAYKDAVTACVAWYKLEGRAVSEYYQAERANNKNPMGPNALVDRTYVAQVGFLGLTDYERARVATVNAERPTPRTEYKMFSLGFDNDAYFKEVDAKINPTT